MKSQYYPKSSTTEAEDKATLMTDLCQYIYGGIVWKILVLSGVLILRASTMLAILLPLLGLFIFRPNLVRHAESRELDPDKVNM